MQDSFELRYPGTILFGVGVRRELPRLLAAVAESANTGIFLVASKSVLTPPLRAELDALCGGRIAGVFTGVPHDPPLAVVDAVIGGIRGSGAGVVIGLGGGSVLDTAKAAAAVAPFGSSVVPFFRGERPLAAPGLPFIAMPTTAGSGAEITSNSVLTDTETRQKKSLRSPHMTARAAVVDVELTLAAPPALTAWSGLDALTQALESYISKKANPATRALAAEATGLLLAALPEAVRDGRDLAARTHVAQGSLLSAMAFSQSGLGAVHGLAHPIGLELDLAHGLTCAVLLPHVLRLNAPACGDDLARLARMLGFADSATLVARIESLCRGLDVPEGFAAHGLREEQFPRILANCRSPSMSANPRELSDAEILALLRRLAAA
jgi:alcohol dehydrogenase class IV